MKTPDNFFPLINADVAFSTAMNNKLGSMPKKNQLDSRLKTFAEPGFPTSFQLIKGEKIFTIGSCFARGIEERLYKAGYDIPTMNLEIPEDELFANWAVPRGALNKYSPISMVNEVKLAFGEIQAKDVMVEVSNDKYVDMQLHTDVPVSLDRAIERREYINRLNKETIQESRVIVITLGLVEVWLDNETGVYLNQTPTYKLMKKKPQRFSFQTMSPEQTNNSVVELIDLFLKYGKEQQKVLLSVSPIPLGRTFNNDDVIVANSYSKSILRVAAEVVKRKYDHVDYFPSYESVLLSNPEKTWCDDRVHVTNETVMHNTSRMITAYEPTE